jgi:hypothetical protein
VGRGVIIADKEGALIVGAKIKGVLASHGREQDAGEANSIVFACVRRGLKP